MSIFKNVFTNRDFRNKRNESSEALSDGTQELIDC